MTGRALPGVLLMLSACTAVPVDPSTLDHLRPDGEFAVVDALGLAPASIGFGDDARDYVPGDVAAYGLVLSSPAGTQRWLATVTLQHGPDPRVETTRSVSIQDTQLEIQSRPVGLRVDLYDERCRLLRSSSVALGDTYLATGLWPLAAIFQRHAGPDGDAGIRIPAAELPRFATSLMALPTLFQLVQDNDALSPILWETVALPSAWSLLTNLGVDVSVYAATDRARFDGPPVLGSGPTCALPVTVSANDQPALLCTLYVTESRPPFRLTAGVVAIEAVHPTDGGRRFSMRLLAARRGAS